MSSLSTHCQDLPTSSSLYVAQRTTSEELIPREILFGNPENISPLLSPNGKYLAYLAPSDEFDVMNIFIRDLSLPNPDKSQDRMITNEPKRAIRSVAWAYDNETIFYMNDNDGDENFHLFAVDALSDLITNHQHSQRLEI